eukprot:192643-Pyramimonas_sp.AAC.1
MGGRTISGGGQNHTRTTRAIHRGKPQPTKVPNFGAKFDSCWDEIRAASLEVVRTHLDSSDPRYLEGAIQSYYDLALRQDRSRSNRVEDFEKRKIDAYELYNAHCCFVLSVAACGTPIHSAILWQGFFSTKDEGYGFLWAVAEGEVGGGPAINESNKALLMAIHFW